MRKSPTGLDQTHRTSVTPAIPALSSTPQSESSTTSRRITFPSYSGLSTDALMRSIVQSAFDPEVQVEVERLWTPSAWRINSGNPGPAVSIFGGVHGNEPCGIYAVCELLRRLVSGAMPLECGSVLLCIANEQAVFHGVRATGLNMNRMFEDERHVDTSYLFRRTEALKSLLEDSDIHIDLHSTSQPSTPFIFLEHENRAEISNINIPFVVTLESSEMHKDFAGTTQSFARRRGAKAYTVENGQHEDPRSREHALQVSIDFLKREGLVPNGDRQIGSPRVLKQFLMHTKQTDDFHFRKPFRSFEHLKQGEIIGTEGGEILIAPQDCYIILPTMPEKEPYGAYLYFLAVEID
ncbi:MAG: succinylglutamate desuccinylase/aspartoacylase family protein [Bdellovibrionales bacterium]|nr:succinylglutamate desuccinylase/aspartoacylase family protein [Bdellovibrionales bacterium]